MNGVLRGVFGLAVGVLLSACSSSDEGTQANRRDALASASPVVEQYARNVHANYAECLTAARALEAAVGAFVANPTAETHEAAKRAWVAARAPYGPSEVHRFYGGPIDDEEAGVEGFVNAWPLDENFIDYTRDDENAGIINRVDLVPSITKELLREENEKGGEKNIATGYHAIEFLLWGQDSEDPAARAPGKRPFTDFVAGPSGTARNQARRAEYLKVVTAMLVEDLETVGAAWQEGRENYARTFQADAKVAITKMLIGMGAMANAELSGERMTVAFKNRGQEDEHSCFSDTTSADLLGNAVGIENVYLGRYGAADGPGLDDLVRAADPALDERMKRDLAETHEAMLALQGVPFDAAIAAADESPERRNVLRAIQALKKEAQSIVSVAAALGVTFELEAPSEEL